MNSTESMHTETMSGITYRDVLRHFKKRNKKVFRHITKADHDFQDAMFDYMSDFMFHARVPDSHDYTKLFSL